MSIAYAPHRGQATTPARQTGRDAALARVAPTLIAFLFVAAYFLQLSYADPGRMLADPDSQWHMAVGRWIVAHGRVPWVDEFSYTQAGRPWLAKEWLSQLAIYAAYAAAGWKGVALLAIAALSAGFALIFDYAARRIGLPFAAAIMLYGATLATPHALARPHVLALPACAAFMYALAVAREKERAPPLAAALIMVAWTNLHGSFALGVVMAFAFAGEAALFGTQGDRGTRLRRWAPFLAATLAATLVTPYGWRVSVIPLLMQGNGAPLAYIGEWAPLKLDLNGALGIAAMAGALIAVALRGPSALARVAMLLMLSALAFRAIRFIGTFVFVSPFVFVDALAHLPRFARKERPLDPEMLKGAAAAGALAVAALTYAISPAPPAQVAPEAALRAARAAHLTGRAYNNYNLGGFFIAAGVKTFIDGRVEQLYLGDYLPKLMDALRNRDPAAFAAILDSNRVAWAMTQAGATDGERLAAMPGWRKVYADPYAEVFARR